MGEAMTSILLLLIFGALVLALIPAAIADNKGHSGGAYYLFGFFCPCPH